MVASDMTMTNFEWMDIHTRYITLMFFIQTPPRSNWEYWLQLDPQIFKICWILKPTAAILTNPSNFGVMKPLLVDKFAGEKSRGTIFTKT